MRRERLKFDWLLSQSQPIEKQLRTRRLLLRRGWGNIFFFFFYRESEEEKRNFLSICINVGEKMINKSAYVKY